MWIGSFVIHLFTILKKIKQQRSRNAKHFLLKFLLLLHQNKKKEWQNSTLKRANQQKSKLQTKSGKLRMRNTPQGLHKTRKWRRTNKMRIETLFPTSSTKFYHTFKRKISHSTWLKKYLKNTIQSLNGQLKDFIFIKTCSKTKSVITSTNKRWGFSQKQTTLMFLFTVLKSNRFTIKCHEFWLSTS